ncbi:bifunctional glutamate--cysteine ligase/glutathione synthetase [Actinobacillus equuli]|nr:bifunctional glutamate--cysteine ligase/glutathione synthetase [Actinobacillus equuli]
MKLQQLIKTHQLGLLFQQGKFGIEKESQRIDNKGNIVTTAHPSVLVTAVITHIFKPILQKANLS